MMNSESTATVSVELSGAVPQRSGSRPEGTGRAQWLAGVLVSLIVAAPCLLQRRIELCDLGSHLYNVWLVQLVRAGRAPGLELHTQWSNTLFDRMLEASVSALGYAGGEKLAVIVTLLAFFWGLFALASAAAGEPAWKTTPLIFAFSYGWVFSMGLMNMYLSLGLAFAALALVHKGRGWQLLWLIPLLAAITMAHMTGTVVVLGLGGLLALLRWKKGWGWELGGILAGIGIMTSGLLIAREYVRVLTPTREFAQRMTGLDQLVLYRNGYVVAALVVLAGMGVVVSCALLQERMVALRRTRLWLLLLAASVVMVQIVPGGYVSQTQGMIGLLPQRMTLLTAAMGCCVVAGMSKRWWHCAVLSLAVLPFFYMYYRDTQNLNRLESKIEQAVQTLPQQARVITTIWMNQSRVQCANIIGRACIGHCYSYANYEPASKQFRLRAVRENPIVTANERDSMDMDAGEYLPKKSEQPIYALFFCNDGSGRICLAPLQAQKEEKN